MKKIIHIITLSVLLFAGCSKPVAVPETPEQFDRYIFFSQNIATKASLIGSVADLKDKHFGVVGFKYNKGLVWNNLKADATPNVFASTPQSVECDANGYGKYSPLQGWSDLKKYAFFAFYPMPNNYVSLVNLGGTTSYTAGVPAIKYTIDTEDIKGSMDDVMIASPHIGLDGSSSDVTNNDVTFSFDHCLSSVGVKIKNSTNTAVTISKVDFTVSGIQNKEIIIPLDKSQATPVSATTPMSASLSLSLTDADKTMQANTTDYVELSDKLIFIPQIGNLTISKFQITFRRGTAAAESFIVNDLTTALEEGKKHLISLNIKESTVDVSYKFETNAWTDIDDVYDTFN